MIDEKKVIVVAAAYNEEGKIGNVVTKTKKRAPFVDEVVVVNDCSSDNTVKEAKAAGATVLSHEKNMGAGAAYRTGYYYGLEKGYDIIAELAGDDQDDPAFIKRAIEPILNDGYDYIQGSRYLYEKKLDLPKFRHVTTRLFSVFFSIPAGKWITDASNGFRAFKPHLLKKINLHKKWLNEYEMEPYFLLEVIRRGYKVKEVGVPKYWPEGKSYSKMAPFKGWWSISKPMIYCLLGIRK